jgi:hypothetical protein
MTCFIPSEAREPYFLIVRGLQARDLIALAANEVCYVASLALRSGLRQRGLDMF